jgi:MFS family permease
LETTLATHEFETPRHRIIIASTVGTTIEFFDFYIYATAAVSVFPLLFFPAGEGSTALLASMATFGVAFVARPIGSLLFGHFGDRAGRKATLLGSLLLMGLATFAIGLLPTYHQIGLFAPALLALAPLLPGFGTRRRMVRGRPPGHGNRGEG